MILDPEEVEILASVLTRARRRILVLSEAVFGPKDMDQANYLLKALELLKDKQNSET